MLVTDHLLDLCEAHGCKALFGIPDPQFFALFDAAHARGWQVVAPHHEAAGGFMAEGWARITGKPALCVASLGPGMANLAPAVAHARAEGGKVLFLGGRRAGMSKAQTGRFQHAEHFPAMAQHAGWSAQASNGVGAVAAVEAALHGMACGQICAAFIELEPQALAGEVIWPYGAPVQAGMPDLAPALALIAQAQSPIILAGHGVHTAPAGEALRDLAQKLACPVVQTPSAMAVVEGLESVSFPYGFSPVTRAVVEASDLVIALGTQLGDQLHFGQNRHWKAGREARRWIRIDRDPAMLTGADVAVPGDLAQVLPALAQACPQRQAQPQLAQWSTAHATHRADQVAAARAFPAQPIHPARLVVEACQVMPDGTILARDGGASVLFQLAYAQGAPRDVLWSQNSGHLGTGLPMAIGAMLAAPDRPALLLTGDSALLFHLAELETAARLGLPLVVAVAVDHQWGLEVGMSRLNLGPSAEAGLGWSRATRFDLLAQGFGCDGTYVDDADALAPALRAAFTAALAKRRPQVLHVAIDPKANAENMPALGEFASWFAA
ncbi:thiamine pyrophosphate-binding protein [Novosphingobium umbonatum]|nr:thiamine pyrophosphate-binding protein [Novosphingobium umbonatum]